MRKNKLPQFFVFLSVCTFLAIFFFVVQQSYNNLIRATAEVQSSPLIRSVSPDLEIDVLDEIEKRQEIIQ
ncbi:MAG: hypothetical protein US68_C0010G0060 [Candidatus Shapirobacteria bacterium GW2011_GWE1_38_10]|uniref:Uncharacterized protein n=1 Tax=Candidatus Shapirobacteria bacterium GW2011_GWE1_38_10 TaxID=1618488 RepID=A0A0G0LB66_9BACT|nr:MAG: hypothetical protein US46_C0013G0015 [Candidatus Shapirobacteria bacterium GW2011_GWF2_37_20]KKQ49926.1 MAG: hypothetical protein US68_C0010G0060 [Candidatus Shapirobacteria bacterium GW2011_GWE1_38_10]KKQ64354.1 MAG: hypothetical protein US85_C0011G0011 [Candidatus Shapirobacteria bacterium GW2011_GWF1_38_23]HBP51530.1 hypothetical protein [Candidatus Shapirobacteria bacterium]